ncbi:hypothetical protein C8J27_101480 [Rhodobacter aestuarii]|uniref:Anti-sigma-F factor NrsF n=1 Tax=Rhodobacter aestuarii TaxID=453582 RepID=A0A1N7IZB5_9RHOB|nr:DUF1109 domain-containing protein [Rhodobacter aestuarii]PTV97365.1 hypothetical protein C8J27_101480 [Rhodobacter aestuarii]SIS42321.1 hypothetical protein SAMN05421580_101162 [Rhodobacter aestuarii]
MTTPDQTDAFIAQLAAQPTPAPLRPARAVALTLAGLLAGLCVLYAILGLRADLVFALVHPLIAAKTLLPLILGVLALGAVFASTRPAQRVTLWPLALPLVVALGLFVARVLVTPADQWKTEFLGQTVGACLLSISLLSLLPLGLGFFALRRGAATKPTLTGALAGLAVGAFAVVGYSLHCIEDSPMFYVPWYGVGIALSTVLGAAAGRRLLRW